jgi:lipid II:glycine glycyltransferase (peptidoglycan interpeptide bridge formation enzyme)
MSTAETKEDRPHPQTDTKANEEAKAATAAALKRKVEAMGCDEITIEPSEQLNVKAAALDAKEKPTRRTLRQALDAMDDQIEKLSAEVESKCAVRDKLTLDIEVTRQTIDAIKQIRADFS